MEDLIVSAKEHKLLKKFQKQLEECYKVEICMPKNSSLESDVVFISINGDKQNRDCVKKFLSEKMNLPPKNIYKGNALIITLSDSEEEASSTIDDSVCILEPSFCSEYSPKSRARQTQCTNSLDDSVCIIESSMRTKDAPEIMKNVCNQNSQCQGKRKRQQRKRKMFKKVRSKDDSSSSDAEVSELCEVSSTTDNVETNKTHNDESIRVEAVTSTGDSVNSVLSQKQTETIKKPKNLGHHPFEADKVDIFTLEPMPAVRRLRPIVIDGNNVAIEHGKVSHTFSSKGILLAIDYFMSRGHTQVTAFVPRFRRGFNPHRNFPTQDPEILDDLAAKQLVVFTPSRRINGKNIASYDDRFIVQLAATNGGVIVSNDNYRDLLNESESFKEAIEQRLLMFCFVGDVFMVPDDPLGRDGPKLKDYLCFPPQSERTESIIL